MSERKRCPKHGIPDCSPLLNGCTWNPDAPPPSQPVPDRAVQWARWSRAWTLVGPLIEPQPWFQAFDAHTKAYCREAVTKSALREPRWNGSAKLGVHQTSLSVFVGRYLVPARDDSAARYTWIERLSKIADTAREQILAAKDLDDPAQEAPT